MSKELIISVTPYGGRIALINEKNLIEYHEEKFNSNLVVGDIILGTVKRVVPGLNAAFIDVGYEKDAFLHYLDLGPNFNSLNKYVKLVQNKKNVSSRLNDFKLESIVGKIGKIGEYLKANQQILVQVAKEPISTKGPRLSCELSLAGRYLVLVPFSNSVNVSKKITDSSERKRLLRLVSAIKPENFGIIIRTVAENKEVSELERDMNEMIEKWDIGIENLPSVRPTEKVMGEINKANSILRDILNESFDGIWIDNKDSFVETKHYIHNIAPDKEKIVKLYTGKVKSFEHFGIEKQLKLLFGRTVSMPNGGYLVIEHTEALHVIDVNSGNKSNFETDQENTAFNVNVAAVKEIARQLRLRDMGGIIVVDFIDMKNPDHKKRIYDLMKEEMKDERAKFSVLPLSKFGLMQITRQRVRPEMNIITREKCPTCNGTGKIGASISVAQQIEASLEYILSKQNESNISLVTHPFIHAYFTGGLPSIRLKWLFKYHKWVKVEKDSSLAITEFHFTNKHGQNIEL